MSHPTRTFPRLRLRPLLALLLMAALLLTAAAGCGKNDTVESTGDPTLSAADTTTTAAPTATAKPTATPQPTVTPTPTPTPALDLASINLFTGLPRENPDDAQPRPVGVMINNTKKALPQIGISQADVIIELPVEGGVTRLLTLFADPSTIPELGSIRSVRHDYVELVASLDVLVTHVGGSYLADDLIAAEKIQTINYMNTSIPFWRDADWRSNRGYEHSVKTTGERIMKYLNSRDSLRKTVKDPQTMFNFQPTDQLVPAVGEPAETVNAPFSRYTKAAFDYDADTKLYSKSQFDQPHLDQATGEAVRFTNVLLLPTSIPVITSAGHIDADMSGGSGLYLSGGFAQPIRWKKGSMYERLRFFTEDGEDLLVNRGKTYIGILPKSPGPSIVKP